MAASQPYEKLDENDNDDYTPGRHINDIPPPQKSMSKRKQYLFITLWTFIVIALTAVVVRSTVPANTSKAAPTATNTNKTNVTTALEDTKEIITTPTANSTGAVSTGIITECGSSPEEARAAGCIFDVMMQLWTPAECYDGNLSERFLAAGKWTWWADAGATKVISDEDMKKGEHDRVYVSADYHKSHCIFAWEKLVRALRNQTPLIEQLISVDHAMHCQHKTLAAIDAKGAIAPKGYTKCADYKTWTQHLPSDHLSSVDRR